MAVSLKDREAMDRQIAALKEIELDESEVATGDLLRSVYKFVNPIRVKYGLKPLVTEE